MKIVIIGAGVAGAVLARRLAGIPGIDLLCLERVQPGEHAEAGTGLNVGPNAIKALRLTDPELAARVEARSLPWDRWTASLADGTPLFDLPMDRVADNPGIRIRWSELYRVLREAAGPAVRYGCKVTAIGRDPSAPHKAFVAWSEDGQQQRMDGIDLLVGADGRYSEVRQAFAGSPEPRHLGVAILRALVDDTSAGLVDDYVQIFNGPHRLLAFRVPPGHVYIAATFPIAAGGPVQPAWNTEAVMRATWQPTSGRPASPQLRWLLDALCARLHDSHWARMQESDVRYHEPDAGILYLGDSAHGMAPTLGQGATQALEDACGAATILREELLARPGRVQDWLLRIARTRTDRVRFAMDLSVRATDTMLAGSDPVAGAKWKTEPPFLEALARLYREPALGRGAMLEAA